MNNVYTSTRQAFDDYGYIIVPRLIVNPENLKIDPPEERGYYKFFANSPDSYHHLPEGDQVKGSLSRYNIPIYRDLHFLIKKEVENILEMDLYPTYFYDRFYFEGQELKRHIDRPACEISVTLQVSSNRLDPWPIWFQLSDKTENYVLLDDGDAIIYKGCEREHWRDPLPSRYNKAQRLWRKVRKLPDDTYHHQIFFHFVNANGPYIHYAYDRMG